MIKLTVDEKEIEVEEGCTVLQACEIAGEEVPRCLLYTSPSPRDMRRSRMPSSA